jgi:sterol O-acyltransferase
MNGRAKEIRPFTQAKVSFFDVCDRRAGFYESDMKGFYIMYILISSSYVIISATKEFTRKGLAVDSVFFYKMTEDVFLLILLWAGVFSYCWTAFLLQLLILKGLHESLQPIFQHLTQSLMFLFTIILAFTRDWGLPQTLFSHLLVITHFMKMHSYTLVNRDLRKSNDPKYPKNIHAKDFLFYLVAPTLVYQTNYVTNSNFRPLYFTKKLILFIVQFWSLYNLISDCLLPVLDHVDDLSTVEVLSRLIFPVLICYLMIFFILFEQILNAFAEIVRFGDREFYQDWWNSTSFEEFNRKWNRPVHLFLHKHIYLECIYRYGWTEPWARAVTFLFSAACHEMVLASICRNVKPYLLGLMLVQIPLVLLQRLMKKSLIGLYVFWAGMILGLPLLLTMYSKFG